MPRLKDDFFSPRPCDRCHSEDAKQVHIMSWFTEERICMGCSEKEDEIKKKLYEKYGSGAFSQFEGCGYIPKV